MDKEASSNFFTAMSMSFLEEAQKLAQNNDYQKAESVAKSAAEMVANVYNADKNNQTVKWQFAVACRMYALYMMINGKHQDAYPYNQLAFSAFQEMYNDQPSDESLFNLSLQAEQTGDNFDDLQNNARAEIMYSLALQARKDHMMNNGTPQNREAVERLSGKLKQAAAKPKKVDVEELHDFFDFSYEEGDKEFESGRFRDAAESYGNAVNAGLAIVEYQGGVQNMRNTGMACKKAADTLMKLRKFGDAVDYYGRMEDLFHRALSESSDIKDLYIANLAQAGAGAAYAAWGRTADARAKYNDALQSAQALSSVDPQFQSMVGEYTAIINSL